MALFGWGKKKDEGSADKKAGDKKTDPKDGKSPPSPTDITARNVAAKLANSSSVQKALEESGAKVGAELKRNLGIGGDKNNPANDESGELGPKAAPKTDALRDELREMLRKKLGILADIKDSALESMADHQINLPISINIAVKDGKIDSAIIRKKIDILLEASGFTDEAKRKKFRISEDGVNWNVPDAVAEQLLPKAEKRGKDFSATNYFRDNVVREIDGLDLADVVKIKGGFIITGVPGSTSRSKLVEGKSNAAELKNKITIDRVIAVDVMNSDIMPVLDAYRKEKTAEEAARPKPTEVAATSATPPVTEAIPLADDTTAPPEAAATTKPSGNVIPAATDQEPLAIALEGEAPPASSQPQPAAAQPAQPVPASKGVGEETVDLNPNEVASTTTPAAGTRSKIVHSPGGLTKPVKKPEPIAKPKSREEKINDAIKSAIGSNYMLVVNDKPAKGQGTYEIYIPNTEKALDQFATGFANIIGKAKREESSYTQWEIPESIMLKLAPKPPSEMMKPDIFRWMESGNATKDMSARLGTPVTVSKSSEYGSYIVRGAKKETTPGSILKLGDILPKDTKAVSAAGITADSVKVTPLIKVTFAQPDFDQAYAISEGAKLT